MVCVVLHFELHVIHFESCGRFIYSVRVIETCVNVLVVWQIAYMLGVHCDKQHCDNDKTYRILMFSFRHFICHIPKCTGLESVIIDYSYGVSRKFNPLTS
jgi:hypothetical protein